MKKIICALIFCCFALIAAAQQFDIEKFNFKTVDSRILTTHNRGNMLYERYHTRVIPVCLSQGDSTTQKKRGRRLFDQAVTPRMKKIINREYPKLGAGKCWLVVELVFERATGKIIDARFVLPADFLEVLTEENVKIMYRRLLRTTIDTTGIVYANYPPPIYPPHLQKIASTSFQEFVKFALEEK